MIVENKLLCEFDLPTLSGITFSSDLVVEIVNEIINNNINGIIHLSSNRPKESFNTDKFKIINPNVVYDEYNNKPFLLLYVNVDIDEKQLSDDEKQWLANYHWRLAMCGDINFDTPDDVIREFKISNINIEILDLPIYNQLLDKVEGNI